MTTTPAIQGPPAAGAEQGEAKKPEAEGSGINWKELLLDKFVDFILIFIGLYAAIAVQKWQDTAKEKEEYVKLLGDFKTELGHNRKQRETIEKDIGKAEAKEPEPAMGPLQKHFDDFKKEADDAEKLLDCLDLAIGIAGRGVPKPGEKEKFATCEPILAAAEKEGDQASAMEAFKPITLSPLYRAEVWQTYLANGIKVFENKELAVKIGVTYASARQVEKHVAEIESTFNENFIQRIAEVMASIGELEESMPEGEDIKAMMAMQPKLGSMSKEMRAHRFATQKVQNVLELKVARLKGVLLEMDKEFEQIEKEIDAELAKQKK